MATALVTGANRGIGLELCRALKERGDVVIATCRNANEELDRLDVRVEADVDVTSERALGSLAKRLAGVSIDLLVCNAGVLSADDFETMSAESIRRQFEVNAIGPLLTVAALVPRMARGGKIGLVTSRMGSIADNTSGGYYGYRMSKTALNMAGASLALDLRDRGIAVAILHPGYVKTAMTDYRGQLDAADSARLLLERLDALTPAMSGSFWHANGTALPW